MVVNKDGIRIKSEVIVYHDETKNAGESRLKGHVLLFVPVKVIIEETGGLFGGNLTEIKTLSNLLEDIKTIKQEFKADHKFHFSEISGKKWAKRNYADKKIVESGVKYLRQTKYFCKLGIIFYEQPTKNQIIGYGGKTKNEKKLRFDETLLRMLLKGAVHYLYNNNHRIRISKIVSDGQPYRRKLSELRIIDRLIIEVRDYVEISEGAELIHLSSDHKRYELDSEEYQHANMLQLADMLLGSTIHSCLRESKVEKEVPQIGDFVEDKKGIIAYPMKEMLDKRKRGNGFKNSSHYKAFTISKAFIKNDGWGFENVRTKEISISDIGQLTLLDVQEKVYE